MQLDRVPPQDLTQNQEYAPPGTAKWVAETVALLTRLTDESVKPEDVFKPKPWHEHLDLSAPVNG